MTFHFLVDIIKFPPIPNHEIGKYTGYTSIHVNKCIVYLFLNLSFVYRPFFLYITLSEGAPAVLEIGPVVVVIVW
jgi:hypothetical protein